LNAFGYEDPADKDAEKKKSDGLISHEIQSGELYQEATGNRQQSGTLLKVQPVLVYSKIRNADLSTSSADHPSKQRPLAGDCGLRTSLRMTA
jgi:hypothetical protein